MTFDFGDFSVTTWDRYDDKQVWRARAGDRIEYFTAERDVHEAVLVSAARTLLGLGGAACEFCDTESVTVNAGFRMCADHARTVSFAGGPASR